MKDSLLPEHQVAEVIVTALRGDEKQLLGVADLDIEWPDFVFLGRSNGRLAGGSFAKRKLLRGGAGFLNGFVVGITPLRDQVAAFANRQVTLFAWSRQGGPGPCPADKGRFRVGGRKNTIPFFQDHWSQRGFETGGKVGEAFILLAMVIPPGGPEVGAMLAAASAEGSPITVLLGRPSLAEAAGPVVDAALALYRDRGWLDRPLDYHRDPPPLTAPKIEGARTGRLHYEHLEFESLYEPHAEEPGRARWLAYAPPRTAHAYMLRHPEPGRPWLVCTNGYRMGLPAIDLRAFAHYHQLLGLDVLVPVLPLHGPRRSGRRSGDGFLGGQVRDTVYGEAQAVWDIRRMIGWLRDDGAETIGATGLSLGGYTSALMASVEPGLACVVAGIPATDLARIFWHHGPPLQLESLGDLGITPARISELMKVVSPLALAHIPARGAAQDD